MVVVRVWLNAFSCVHWIQKECFLVVDAKTRRKEKERGTIPQQRVIVIHQTTRHQTWLPHSDILKCDAAHGQACCQLSYRHGLLEDAEVFLSNQEHALSL